MPKPSNDYTSFNASPSGIAETSMPNDYLSVRANPEEFGAGIGAAAQNLGKATEQVSSVADQFATMASESRANDDFANKYSVQAADLRKNFDMLDGQDKIHGAQDYIQNLQKLGQSFTGDDADGNMIYKRSMGQLIGRHIFAETTGVDREIVDSQKKFAASSADDLMAANNGYAAANYNNPAVVSQSLNSNDSLVAIQHIDAGHDPSDPISADLIKQKQDAVAGDMASGMINRAVSSGDMVAANKIRADYSPVIPGYKQLQLDSFLHAGNMQQTGAAGTAALAAGLPLPETVGAPASHVQATIANTAKASGIDPNEVLTVARIESSYGANVGSRGTIGQDKGSAGQPLDAQAQALCDNWKAAKQPATDALGRAPEGWEQYTVYQQGAGGGAALLKADPNARAIDVLKPLYANTQDAVSAITKNGGVSSMSVGDFLAQEKQRYNDNFDRAKCEFPDGQIPGDAITAPHQTSGPAVQPGANPMQDLRNWNRANEMTLSQIQAIPNVETRQRLLQDNNEKTRVIESKANAYKNDLVNQAGQLAANPNFTSMNQVPTNMQAALLEANPNTLSFLEKKAQDNLDKQSGTVTKDQRDYGSGINNVLNDVWDGKITNQAQLHDAVKSGQLSLSGYDRLSKELIGPKEDVSAKASEMAMQKAAFNDIKMSITNGIESPQSAHQWASTLPALYTAIDKRKSAKDPVPPGQYYDPNNKEYIGNDVAALKMPQGQAVSSQIQANKATVKGRSLFDIIADAKATNDPNVQAQLRQEAIDKGYYTPGPAVPLAGGQ